MAGQFDLSGRTALVTGASGGLGRHFAGVLAAAGAQVVVAARRADALEETVAGIRASGGTAEAVPLDVTDAASVEAAFDAAEALFGAVDVLVNNSGVAAGKSVLDLSEDEFDRVLDTNLKGAWLTSRSFGRRARAADRPGVIVNVASILGFRVAGHVSAYAASKAGLVRLTEAMALELARHRIRVNALAPGYFATDINGGFFETEAGRKMLKRIPQRRIGDLGDLDGPLLLLASDASAYMTGATIAVDGGHLVASL
jgi:NAD(P)-dependent dehydrogenase (short-subunit alcohol dehydrogenase family)